MKTRTTHVTNFGSFGPQCQSDTEGYIKYHDSPRYAAADEDKLEAWTESHSSLVRNAAAVELACRQVTAWQEAN